MHVHDWMQVDAGIFHDVHVAWIAETRKALNGGLLPEGYYALAEQHMGQTIPDLLARHADARSEVAVSGPDGQGGTAVAEAPPQVRRHVRIEPDSLRARQRTLAVRHVSGHRLIAILEIVSPGNKDRAEHLNQFINKLLAALKAGVHVLVVDLFPPGRLDPRGIHGAALARLAEDEEPYDLPIDEPITFASYVADRPIEAYLEHACIGARLPLMPLFLSPERYVNVPLESTYMAAYSSTPAYWRKVLETGARA